MNHDELQNYRKNLLEMKSKIINSSLLKSVDDLMISSDDLADETDMASNIFNQQISFSIRDLEFQKLKMIEVALRKIDEGSFGLCEECDEEISSSRLRLYPWAGLCIVHAEEREREVAKFAKKSM